jgi:hypothetical protein
MPSVEFVMPALSLAKIAPMHIPALHAQQTIY